VPKIVKNTFQSVEVIQGKLLVPFFPDVA